MSAPIVFTDEERSAIGRLDKLSKALSQTNKELKDVNRRIIREKATRDQLIARRNMYRSRIKEFLELIDTAKNREVV